MKKRLLGIIVAVIIGVTANSVSGAEINVPALSLEKPDNYGDFCIVCPSNRYFVCDVTTYAFREPTGRLHRGAATHLVHHADGKAVVFNQGEYHVVNCDLALTTTRYFRDGRQPVKALGGDENKVAKIYSLEARPRLVAVFPGSTIDVVFRTADKVAFVVDGMFVHVSGGAAVVEDYFESSQNDTVSEKDAKETTAAQRE
ncbi:MAG: hypothetical protein J6K25_08475 [Thermoguttaceae bacterium]|nr:hypothetical protein [Thermoguttaceae bacterium]